MWHSERWQSQEANKRNSAAIRKSWLGSRRLSYPSKCPTGPPPPDAIWGSLLQPRESNVSHVINCSQVSSSPSSPPQKVNTITDEQQLRLKCSKPPFPVTENPFLAVCMGLKTPTQPPPSSKPTRFHASFLSPGSHTLLPSHLPVCLLSSTHFPTHSPQGQQWLGNSGPGNPNTHLTTLKYLFRPEYRAPGKAAQVLSVAFIQEYQWPSRQPRAETPTEQQRRSRALKILSTCGHAILGVQGRVILVPRTSELRSWRSPQTLFQTLSQKDLGQTRERIPAPSSGTRVA